LLRQHRRLPRGPGGPGRRRGQDRGEVPAHPPQAHGSRDYSRRLVAPGLSRIDAMSDHPVPRKRVRASDEERDAVLSVLQQAHAAGRLSVEELGERQDLALQIRYTDEVSDLVEDLPEGSHLLPTLGVAGAPSPSVRSTGPPTVAPSPQSVSMSVMSGKTVDIAPGTVLYRNFGWWGGDDIYLGDAMGPGVVITLELHCIMAGHNIYVPEGVRVIDESL